MTGKNFYFYDTTRAMHAILPGGEKHSAYRKELDLYAAFIRGLCGI